MFKHILMPTDGSEHSERAVKRGIEHTSIKSRRASQHGPQRTDAEM